MAIQIRAAEAAEIETVASGLVQAARHRATVDPVFWALVADPVAAQRTALSAALSGPASPIRQRWILAFDDDALCGVAHTILLPVPPIYAGEFGPPGLLMEDCYVDAHAPDGTAAALLAAAEADLTDAGAQILLASGDPDGAWGAVCAAAGYDPLTLYLARSDLSDEPAPGIAPAQDSDIAEIVRLSADNRQVLFDLDAFWKPHPEADARFRAWMTKSLSLTDRDMRVARNGAGLDGYVVAQPATPLHFPPPHDISAIGVIDDFFHTDIADPKALARDGAGTRMLFAAAESALAGRERNTAMVVCPAAWQSKITWLQGMGYRTAITWSKKRRP